MSDTVQSLRELIIAGMDQEPYHLDIIDESGGCGSKFKVICVSDSFQGVVSFRQENSPSEELTVSEQSLLDRQRRVNTILQDPMKRIHALSLKTWTVAEYEKKKKEGVI